MQAYRIVLCSRKYTPTDWTKVRSEVSVKDSLSTKLLYSPLLWFNSGWSDEWEKYKQQNTTKEYCKSWPVEKKDTIIPNQ